MQPAHDVPGRYQSLRSSSVYAILPLFAILALIDTPFNPYHLPVWFMSLVIYRLNGTHL
ncbi:MAG: hypothetical protein ACXWPS_24200 [Ktedonobacteraceae bacterium]